VAEAGSTDPELQRGGRTPENPYRGPILERRPQPPDVLGFLGYFGPHTAEFSVEHPPQRHFRRILDLT
jgi:hypothetical protein